MIGGMPELARTRVTLRIFGDSLDPREITRLLGVAPTTCAHKGGMRRTPSGREIVARTGSWLLEVDVPGNLDTQIGALLAMLPGDLAVWHDLCRRFRCDVFCGLFMREGNEGTELEPGELSMLGERGLRLGLDIYDGPE